MNIKVENYNLNNKRQYQPIFKGPIDGILTNTLRVLDTNEMANAAVLDLGTMVAPRTYFDAKDRNKYAGGETFIRELCGTLINCFAAGTLGVMIARVANKYFMPHIKTNPNSWFSEDSIEVLKKSWNNSDNNPQKYVDNVLKRIEAQDGRQRVKFADIDWNNVEWFERKTFKNYKWDNAVYKDIGERVKTRQGFVESFTKVMNDKNITKHDKQQVFEIFETRLTNALKANRDIELKTGKTVLKTTLANILRDTYDAGKDIFTDKNRNIDAVLKKIHKVNKMKIFGALSIASALGISVQKLNRKLTEKRTGKKGFVGEVDYMDNNTKQADTKGLKFKKLLACAGMVGMVLAVMKVKSPKDFVKKLQFTGPVSTGNAIKTVYCATILGRFLAADSNNELRESVVRDYLGFLNWLVLGGFAAKGVANILDLKANNLFNISKNGKGIKHWLNDLTLKTHAEIAAKGKDFAKKNIWKLNAAHIGGLAYSTVMLGILLPKLNTHMTKSHANK